MAFKQEARAVPDKRVGTSYDVARLAGVSQSAVSRCFREGGSVSPATRDRILAAANELGYRPNAIAQGLITRRSMMVAVVIANLTNQIYPEVLSQLTTRLSARGMRVLLFTLDEGDDVDAMLDQIGRYQVGGAIINAELSRAQVTALETMRIPLVLYNRQIKDVLVASVMCESGSGEALLIDGIVASGARTFGIIAGPERSTVGEARVCAAIERLAATGLETAVIERGDFSYASGRAAALRLLDHRRIDAIIAANDVMALGAMDAIRVDRGLTVPDDVSVVGFDGVAPARWASYDLTTVRQPVGRMAEAAVTMLVERIDDPAMAPERRLFSGNLIPGSSARLG